MREMTADDVDAVWAIEQTVQAYPWTRGNFEDALSSGYHCVVDEHEGDIVSYAIVMPVLDEAELLNIGVAADQQRKGWGQAMLQAVLNWAVTRGMQRMFLEVRASNAPAIGLYRKVGYAEIGKRRGYYRNAQGSEDALLMACVLTGEVHG